LCGRYVIYTTEELVDLRAIVDEAQHRANAIQKKAVVSEAGGQETISRLAASEPIRVQTGEIFPTNIAPVLITPLDAGPGLSVQQLKPYPMIWGYPQFGGRKGVVFNTRLETAYEKSFWRDSLEERRCVVPASGFFEWQHGGPYDRQRYLFDLPNESMLYLAGIYKPYPARDVALADRFSIMTTISNDSIHKVHDRMPVVLRGDEVIRWLYGDPFSFIDREGIDLRKRVAS
jgi:putative SOS response-associated peptidase YedK